MEEPRSLLARRDGRRRNGSWHCTARTCARGTTFFALRFTAVHWRGGYASARIAPCCRVGWLRVARCRYLVAFIVGIGWRCTTGLRPGGATPRSKHENCDKPSETTHILHERFLSKNYRQLRRSDCDPL